MLGAGALLAAEGAAAQAPAAAPASGASAAPRPVGGESFLVEPSGFGAAVPARPGTGPTVPEVRLGIASGSPFGGPPLQPRGGLGRAVELQPSLGFGFQATDNFRFTPRNRESELTLIVSPGIGIAVDTASAQGRLTYAPQLNFYAGNTQSDRVDQRFLGAATLTVVPETVFVDLRALGQLTPRDAALPTTVTTTQPRSAFTQEYFLQFNPYVTQRYGSLATSTFGYSLAYSSRDTGGPGGAAAPQDDDLVSHTGFAALSTGEDFGRLGLQASVRATAFTGGGEATDGASRALGLLEGRYAFTRTVIGLAEVGYENLRYNGLDPVRVEGPVWGVGVRLEPSERSSIVARYRRRDGSDAPEVEATVGIGARTVLFARYNEQLTTSQIQTSDLLSQLTLDPLGNPVDSRSGAPLPEFGSTGGFQGARNGIFRSRRGTASGTYFLPRDSFTLQYVYDERVPVSVPEGQLAFTQVSDSLSLIWQRQLPSGGTVFGSAGYSWGSPTLGGSRSETITGRVGLNMPISRSLSGGLQYVINHRTGLAPAPGTTGSQDATQNILLGNVTVRF